MRHFTRISTLLFMGYLVSTQLIRPVIAIAFLYALSTSSIATVAANSAESIADCFIFLAFFNCEDLLINTPQAVLKLLYADFKSSMSISDMRSDLLAAFTQVEHSVSREHDDAINMLHNRVIVSIGDIFLVEVIIVFTLLQESKLKL